MLNNRISNLSILSAFSVKRLERTMEDVNCATLSEMAEIVGDSFAGKIVNFREKHGRFRSVDDFLSVPGLNTKVVRLLKENFYVLPNFPDKIVDVLQQCEYKTLADFHDMIVAKPFFVLHTNVRNLRKNLFKLIRLIQPLKYLPDVICIAETRNPPSENDVSLLNYEFYSTKCTCAFQLLRGVGGTAIYVKKDRSFSHHQRKDLEFSNADTESTWIEISPRNGEASFVVGSMYRHQYTGKIQQFMNELRVVMKKIQKEKKMFYILGDINVDLSNEKKSKQLRVLLEEEDCKLLISKPTQVKRTRRATQSGLNDHIYTNNKRGTYAGIVQLQRSPFFGHFPTYCTIDSSTKLPKITEEYPAKS